MAGINEDIAFVPLRLAVLVISDTRTEADDRSGKVLKERALGAGHEVVAHAIVPDDQARVVEQLRTWIADPQVDAVVSTGSTGITGRDIAPEAFRSVYDKEIEGFGELFRRLSFESVGVSTIQSRATAGVAGGTLLFALPGSPGACRDGWDGILVHQLDIRYRPCNFAELLPRLQE